MDYNLIIKKNELQSLNTRQSSGNTSRPNLFQTFQFQLRISCFSGRDNHFSFFHTENAWISRGRAVVTKPLITIFAVCFPIFIRWWRSFRLPEDTRWRLSLNFVFFSVPLHKHGIIKRKIKWNVKSNRTVDNVHGTVAATYAPMASNKWKN